MLAKVDVDKCIGCKICTKVCPVLSIKVENKKAVVEDDQCRACGNCADRCPTYAIEMVMRETPIKVGVDVSKFDHKEIRELCEKAHFNPEQVLCYCTGVRADEVAAAILDGADTPEKISSVTGIRTGCTIECVQTVLRMLDAAGIELKPVEGGWQWYGKTTTSWTLPNSVKEKYPSFYFEEDNELLDRIVNTVTESEKEGSK
jgi:Fe-S-cluster-containing hydrogenase component 2